MNFRRMLIGCLALITSAVPALAQKPQNYVNSEFGLRVSFPADGKVCPALSGDHPHGFYAWYHGPPTPCGSTHIDPVVSAISVNAYYNSDYTSAWDQLESACRSRKPNALVGYDELDRLAFKGYESVTCLQTTPDGRIEIDVAALGGKWIESNDSPALKVRSIIYFSHLSTNPKRFKSDMVMFRHFMDALEIRE